MSQKHTESCFDVQMRSEKVTFAVAQVLNKDDSMNFPLLVKSILLVPDALFCSKI